MSVQKVQKRFTVPSLTSRKAAGEDPIVCLTSYHAHTARLIDPYVDLLLVGDSLGMVMYGMESTLGVTLDMMIAHGAAVVRGSERALVVVDMPFGTYEESPEVAFRNAARIIKETGCQAVKLEGGQSMAATIAYMHKRGIPVMAHIGLTPQSVNVMGGFKTQGRTHEEWTELEADAAAVAKAGAFSVVLEGMAAPLADKITAELTIPTIGIGSSVYCDGQVLVTDDLIGLNKTNIRFVKKFINITKYIDKGLKRFKSEVKQKKYPTKKFSY